jgi:protein phosphatase 1G
MEDSHIVELDLGGGTAFFGVYDGHGGTHTWHVNMAFIGNEVADFVRDHLIQELRNLQSFKSGDYEQAMKDIYLRMDEMLKTPYGKQKLEGYRKSSGDSRAFGR